MSIHFEHMLIKYLHTVLYIPPNSKTTQKNNNTKTNVKTGFPECQVSFIAPTKCRTPTHRQLLHSETKVLSNKNSEDFVNIVDGRVTQCILIVRRLVPHRREWVADHMYDRNICNQTTITHNTYVMKQ